MLHLPVHQDSGTGSCARHDSGRVPDQCLRQCQLVDVARLDGALLTVLFLD